VSGKKVSPRHCGQCGHAASEGARFCEQCGSALTPGGRPLQAPDPLAAKILSERPAIEGERKQVTVMFTDIVGSMELTRSLDTERWGVVLDRFLALAAGAVHGLEGTVNQFTGDGLMAVFGAPLAHEDHARRASLAVLELQREVAGFAVELAQSDEVEFAIRCGLNSGEVIVGSIGDDLHMDFTPIGNTTALGKRMESLAPVGSTAISASTAALVAGEFELRELGEFEVKGAAERQRVLELVGPGAAQTRLEAVAATRGLSRFVGRDPERAQLEAALAGALSGKGRAVGIVGEPGVGKSRLVREFVNRCRSRGISVNSAGCVAHGRFVPFLSALALYRHYFGIGERDAPELARERIETTMLALDPAFAADLPLLFDFLGVPDPDRPLAPLDPEARPRQLLSLITRGVKARSRHQPAVLVFEDLHWIDDASAAFLEALVEVATDSRTLLVTTYRPEHQPAWTNTGPHTELALPPLSAEASAELLVDLLGSDTSLDGLAGLIEERTGGNPFFIEEIVQGLAESGHLTGGRGGYRLAGELGDLVLPPTVQAVLAARIDRLPAREKALVQTMSVIGKDVPGPLLSEVSSVVADELAAAVTRLAVAHLVSEQDAAGGGREYVFKHPLTQEVAYGSQLTARRARVHAAVAAAIERTYPDGLDERAALIAHHCEAAGDKLKAVHWHARAGAWAEVTSPADGMRHWRRVRQLASELDSSPAVDELATKARIGILGLAWRLGMSPQETAAIHAEAQEPRPGKDASVSVAVEQVGDSPQQDQPPADRERFLLDVNYSGTLFLGGQGREGLELARRLSREAVASGDPGLAIAVGAAALSANWIAGSLHEAVEVADRVLGLAGDDTTAGAGLAAVSPYSACLKWRGVCAGHAGDVARARSDLERAIAVAREHGDAEMESSAHSMRSWLQTTVGESASALDSAERGLELAEAAGNTLYIARAQAALALAHAHENDIAEALDHAESALATIGERGTGLYLEPMLLASIAKARLRLGEPEAALAAAEEAIEIMDARGLTACALTAPIALAQVLIATEGAAAGERIESVLARAMQVARESGALVYEPQIHHELAALARLRGDEAGAEREQAQAERILAGFRAPGDRPAVAG
jgi:class 3 adenylate cyclase/tetratricopeptide (TPR) repeat protein